MNDIARAKNAETFYASFLSYTETLFNGLTARNELDPQSVIKKIKALSEFVHKEHRYLMYAKQVITPAADENYHVAHSVRSSIIAMIIGAALKLPRHRLIELGIAALLRDISILKLPPAVYLQNRALTEQEKRLLFVHPTHSSKMLKAFDFPVSICEAVLEHHERENGSGYPQQLTGERLGMNGKIIAIACAYETFSTDDINETKCGHKGMITLLKNEGKQFDESVIRALVFSLSVYPIGMYVLLSNGKQGQVIDTGPETPRFPIVKILGELSADGKEVIAQTSSDSFSIVRPLTRKETGG